MSDKPSSKKSTKSKKGAGGAIAARLGLYGVLVVAAVVLLLIRSDRAAKNEREQTLNAWNDALDKDELMLRCALADLVVGNPEVGEMIKGGREAIGVSHQVYTWKGPFSSYTATVEYGVGGDDPLVLEVYAGDSTDSEESE